MTQVQVDDGGEEGELWQVVEACVRQIKDLQEIQVGQCCLRDVAKWVTGQVKGAQVG